MLKSPYNKQFSQNAFLIIVCYSSHDLNTKKICYSSHDLNRLLEIQISLVFKHSEFKPPLYNLACFFNFLNKLVIVHFQITSLP